MSREIKFRAWDKQHHEWLGADAWYVSDSSSVLAIWPEVKKGFQVSVNMETLGAERVEITQYTGLKDRNGAEIYEGDIIQKWNTQTGYKHQKSVVRYNEHSARFTGLSFGTSREIEVISNIYEHSHLLEANQ